METFCDRLAAVRARIDAAAVRHGREPGSVGLIAVGKNHPAATLAAAFDCGQRAFGENYVQEFAAKAAALAGHAIEWHFIGPLQANKSRAVAATAAWVHTIDRLRIATRLSAQRAPELPPLNVLIQVNIDGGANKSGVAPQEAAALADGVAGLPNLTLRGLMAIPEPADGVEEQRRPCARLRELRDELNGRGHRLDTLSMGMSDDLEAAVAEGATMVRIGTAIFGGRGG